MQEIYENKRRFIEKLRDALVMVERFDIADIVYAVRENTELVEITFKCGFKKYLDVTGDSEYAIIIDIIRAIG